MKKIAVFIFTFALGAGYAFAIPPECRNACYAELGACMDANPTGVGICTKIYNMCLDECEEPHA